MRRRWPLTFSPGPTRCFCGEPFCTMGPYVDLPPYNDPEAAKNVPLLSSGKLPVSGAVQPGG
jgi:hypothetical protein